MTIRTLCVFGVSAILAAPLGFASAPISRPTALVSTFAAEVPDSAEVLDSASPDSGAPDDSNAAPASVWRLRERQDVAEIWNGVTTSFAFASRPDAVYVAFYAADRSATVGRLPRGSDVWELKTLPTKIEWDSHNYLTLAFDADDVLHVSGNMHCVPLIYFRATKPNDVSTLERVPSMVGDREGRATYPSFLRDKKGRLVFTYRDGASGNGDQIWNVYDESTRTWSRLLDKPLFNGEGLRNAYFTGPTLGPDGRFHVAWVWRETPDCATNRDLSYARSDDLVHWENSNGEPLELPISLETGEIVAPIPPGGGLLNPLIRMSFDADKRVVLSYTKYDDAGYLQIWNARRDADGWTREPATDWDLDWKFSGGGSIIAELDFGAVRVAPDGKLAQRWTKKPGTKDATSGTIWLDAKTLKPTDPPQAPDASTAASQKPTIPEFTSDDAAEVNRIESDDPRLLKRAAELNVDGERWIFRWEAPAPNRDLPQPDGAPKPTKLRVLKFEKRA